MMDLWQGVVEDRFDPLKLGRCRVRILGYHTTNKVEDDGIPTEHLPWATPSQPINSAAMNGVGITPMGPVEGTWVFGFFRDGKNAQEPVMVGTFGGIPEKDYKHDPDKGFNDPYGVYPLSTHLGEPDTNRAARGGGALPVPLSGSLDIPGSEDSPHLVKKRGIRLRGDGSIPVGIAGDMSKTVVPNASAALYQKANWNEPNPRYGGTSDSDTEYNPDVGLSSLYPFNHVRMGESGHIEEWDDTPTAERLHRYHKAGTFEEIQPDGTKVVKVMGDDYEIVMKNKNVFINGTCNVTITGDCRMLYQGDLVQNVVGDYHLNVQGDMRTKVAKNWASEGRSDRKTVINGTDDLFIGVDSILNVGVNQLIDVAGDSTQTIGKFTTLWHLGGCINSTGFKGHIITSSGDIGISAGLNLGLSCLINYSRTALGTSTETTTLLHTETCIGGRLETTTGFSVVTAGFYANISGIITLN
jgi:hypothetical protein